MSLAGWQFYNKITIDNTGNANALTDYQVKINLDSTNFDFSKAQTNGEDIRILDADNSTPLNFWIEKWDSTNKLATLWVKVSSISESSFYTIYMYCGNLNVTSDSDEVATLDLVDHDWDLSNYTIGGGHFAWSQETSGIYGNTIKAYNNSSGGDYCVRNNFTIADAAVSILTKTPTVTDNDQLAVNARWTDENNKLWVRLNGFNNRIDFYENVSGTSNLLAQLASFTLTIDIYRIDFYMFGNQVKVVVTDVTTANQVWDSGFVTTNITTAGQVGPCADAGTAGTTQYWDNFRIRKYTSPEPTTSVGKLQTNGNAIMFGMGF